MKTATASAGGLSPFSRVPGAKGLCYTGNMMCDLKGNRYMKKGKTKTFFQPTKFKVITAIVIAALYPLGWAVSYQCLKTHSNILHAICDSVGIVFGVLYLFVFRFPSFIVSQYNWTLYRDIPSPIWTSLNTLFTLALAYLLACALSSLLNRK